MFGEGLAAVTAVGTMKPEDALSSDRSYPSTGADRGGLTFDQNKGQSLYSNFLPPR